MERGKDYIGTGVGGLLLNEKGEILLLKRSRQPEAGLWSLPGGAVEFGEKASDAIIREVKEETNLTGEDVTFIGFKDYILEKEKSHWISLFFKIDCRSYEATNMEPEKHSSLKWFKLDKLPTGITSNSRDAIKNYKRSIKNK